MSQLKDADSCGESVMKANVRRFKSLAICRDVIQTWGRQGLGVTIKTPLSRDAPLLKRFFGFRKTAAAKIVRFVTANPYV